MMGAKYSDRNGLVIRNGFYAGGEEIFYLEFVEKDKLIVRGVNVKFYKEEDEIELFTEHLFRLRDPVKVAKFVLDLESKIERLI